MQRMQTLPAAAGYGGDFRKAHRLPLDCSTVLAAGMDLKDHPGAVVLLTLHCKLFSIDLSCRQHGQ